MGVARNVAHRHIINDDGRAVRADGARPDQSLPSQHTATGDFPAVRRIDVATPRRRGGDNAVRRKSQLVTVGGIAQKGTSPRRTGTIQLGRREHRREAPTFFSLVREGER